MHGGAPGIVEAETTVFPEPDVADFARRAEDWWSARYDEVAKAPPDYFAYGCGW